MRIWAEPEELSNLLEVVSISGQLDQKYNIDGARRYSRREIERLSTQSPGSRFCFWNVGNKGPFTYMIIRHLSGYSLRIVLIVKFLRNEPHVASRDTTTL
jgi:hypothetical protein